MQNDMFRDQIENLEREVHRLHRIDIKLNRELVQKPYNYINEVRDALDKEQKAIVNIVKTNNDKYITKIG
jgi:hemerythrin-like domain-containing protein